MWFCLMPTAKHMRYNVWVKRKPLYMRDKHISVRLLFALVVFVCAVLFFAKLAWDVREHETVLLDGAILIWIHELSAPWLNAAAKFVTQLGGPLFVPIFTVLVASLLWLRHYRDHVLLIVVGVGGASLMSLALKVFFARARPDLWEHLVHETSFAFPSGHAIASAALAASIVAALWFTRWRYVAMGFGAAYVLVIGFTRLYLGVHYPTDIIAGWLVGIGWVAAVSVIFLTSPLSLKRPNQKS